MSAIIGFRKAVPGDKEFLVDLRIAAMNEHLIQAKIFMDHQQHALRVNEFFNDSHLILKGGEPIGLLKLGLLSKSLHIRQFQILPKFHGLGIGSKVLEVVKKKADALTLPITLNVLLNNPAKQLYLRHGFIVEHKNDFEYHMKWHKKAPRMKYSGA